jgi:soluble cytochrome b562
MRTHARFLLTGAVLVALGGWSLISSGRADDDKADVKSSVQKVADAYSKDDTASAASQAKEVAKSTESLEDVMRLLTKRVGPKQKSPPFGFGDPPGKLEPDGIEAKLQVISKDKPAKLKQEAGALEEMAYRLAAIAEIAKNKPTDDVKTPQNKKDWEGWSEDMRRAAGELAKAAKAGDASAIKKAAQSLNSSCSNCHGKFRKEDE